MTLFNKPALPVVYIVMEMHCYGTFYTQQSTMVNW